MIAAFPAARGRDDVGRAVVGVGVLAVAVLLRAAIGGSSPLIAFTAGSAFGLGLAGAAIVAGRRVRRPTLSALALGVAGGLGLILLPVLARPTGGLPLALHPEPFPVWLIVTAIVAIGEEVMLRGVLFDALRPSVGIAATVALTSLTFALIHVPAYGWHVVPLDLAVGVWLAGLRLLSGGVAAPATAHILADVATWWL